MEGLFFSCARLTFKIAAYILQQIEKQALKQASVPSMQSFWALVPVSSARAFPFPSPYKKGNDSYDDTDHTGKDGLKKEQHKHSDKRQGGDESWECTKLEQSGTEKCLKPCLNTLSSCVLSI